MAGPTLMVIREKLAEQVFEKTGLRISPYMVARPQPPQAHIVPGEISYDRAMARGIDSLVLVIQVFVAVVSETSAQKRLDAYLAPSGSDSIKAAVEADRTLGGVVADASVVSASGYRVYEIGGRAPVLGAEWTVEILASGQ